MKGIPVALAAATRSLFSRRMFGLVFGPVTGATLFWVVVAWLGWGHWAGWFRQLYAHLGLTAGSDVGAMASWFGGALALTALGVVLVIAILATALLITSVIVMPVVIDEIASRYFPALDRKHGGTKAGSLLNAARACLVYMILTVLTLPLWFAIPVAGWLLPLLLNGWLVARLFRYDALAEHASYDEYRAICHDDGRSLLLMGFVLAAIQLIPSTTLLLLPLAILLLPVYTALAYVHFALRLLEEKRAANSLSYPSMETA